MRKPFIKDHSKQKHSLLTGSSDDKSQDYDLSDEELLRYSRQIMLPQIDISGQQKLLDSHVILFGAGGLGSPIAMYLVASGVGELTIVDPDHVDLSNLQRQIMHSSDDIGSYKVYSAQQTLVSLNKQIKVNAINTIVEGSALVDLVNEADVIVDATDNFTARFAINMVCVKQKKPLVVGATIRFEGQVAVFAMQANSACYQCLYPNEVPQALQESCSESGVLGSVAGIIGCIQATEVIKVLLHIGNILSDRLLLIDALNMEWHSVKIKKDPKCLACAT